jgi:hypothetical protein
MWHEENFWNVSVLQTVHLSKLVTFTDYRHGGRPLLKWLPWQQQFWALASELYCTGSGWGIYCKQIITDSKEMYDMHEINIYHTNKPIHIQWEFCLCNFATKYLYAQWINMKQWDLQNCFCVHNIISQLFTPFSFSFFIHIFSYKHLILTTFTAFYHSFKSFKKIPIASYYHAIQLRIRDCLFYLTL